MKKPPQHKGILYIVATPIGNLEDITFRAVRILKEVDIIAAEDTRRTGILLKYYSIKTPLVSYHEHNKYAKGKQILLMLDTGKRIALVSDAGTPGISDPGYYLINLALKNDIEVTPVPGPSAATAALSISGLPTDRFIFEGFLPSKTIARRKRIENIKEEKRTIILYESPNRIRTTLFDLLNICGDREVVLTRELTKVFEEVIRGKISDIIIRLEGKRIKGEITLLLSGNIDKNKTDDAFIKNLLIDYQKKFDLPIKELISMISKDMGISKRDVYQESLKLTRTQQQEDKNGKDRCFL
ncbi:MAG: 16S rRNA (cytidine(1402)-2'-O)-methyltransferase [Thermodesulfobacteriota bacterium]|nr:16S rRNA (cytidine(1402)-2'-O)-methyltransferase [Thermodesulfobacteriota bacterium]